MLPYLCYIKKKAMNNKYLSNLAQQILLSSENGLSKVKFAKTIYYVHKALVMGKNVMSQDLVFIRMPLGPVPLDFMDLKQEPSIGVRNVPNSLTYNAEVYFLKQNAEISRLDSSAEKKLTKVSQELFKISTSVLVAHSHKEPTWMSHSNGEQYFISPDDLRRGLPSSEETVLESDVDNQHLQAQLINGMVDEIVDETTELEYSSK